MRKASRYFAVRREKGLLKGVMHRHLDAVDKVEDVEKDPPVQVRGWPVHASK